LSIHLAYGMYGIHRRQLDELTTFARRYGDRPLSSSKSTSWRGLGL